MVIDMFKIRTASDPLNGIRFTAAEKKRIDQAMEAFATVDRNLLLVMKKALGREIVYLESVSDWVDGEDPIENVRIKNLQDALISYEAIKVAMVAARIVS